MIRTGFVAAACILAALAITPETAEAQDPPLRLTLEEAMERARDRSPGVTLALHGAARSSAAASAARARRFPTLSTTLELSRFSGAQEILLAEGSLGTLPGGGGPMPPGDAAIDELGPGVALATITLAQPLTQLFGIRSGFRAAEASGAAALADYDRAVAEASISALRLFAGLLTAGMDRDAAQLRVAATEVEARRLGAAVGTGVTLQVALAEARLSHLWSRYQVLLSEDAIDDLSFELAQLLGLPPETRFHLQPPADPDLRIPSLDEAVERALRTNSRVRAARARAREAGFGLEVALSRRLPDVGLFAQHVFQNAMSLFPANTLRAGIQLEWTPLDPARRHRIEERRAAGRHAESELERTERSVRGEVERAHRALERAVRILEISREAAALRADVLTLRQSQYQAGTDLEASVKTAEAELAEAQAERARARMGVRIALAELELASPPLSPSDGVPR
jgi:outer membrane protein TolC